MLKAAVLAAAECKIDALSEIFRNLELKEHWRLILNSIPETLIIYEYKHLIPVPNNVQNNINNVENLTTASNREKLLNDSIENIVSWAIERCYQIIKNTLNVNEFALPFLLNIFEHLELKILNPEIRLSKHHERYLFCHYDSISMLYSFNSILRQFSLLNGSNIDIYSTSAVDPIKFILETPLNRFKMIVDQYSQLSYLELETLFSNLFDFYYSMNYLKLIFQRHKNTNGSEFRISGKCRPFTQNFAINGYFEFMDNLEICKDFNFEGEFLFDHLKSNFHISFEDLVLSYLFDLDRSISTDLFCKITKILIKNSKPTKNYFERYISCPIKVIQMVLLCIYGIQSPLLNIKAIDIQDYIDEIYECTPKNAVIVDHLKKELIVRKIIKPGSGPKGMKISRYICCPFCKNPSIEYQSKESLNKYFIWLKDIYYSMELIEKQQLVIDLLKELPFRFTSEITFCQIIKITQNPIRAECFLINLINKLPEVSSIKALKTVINLYLAIISSLQLPKLPFGTLLNTLFYILEKLLFRSINDDLLFQEIIYYLSYCIESKKELIQYLNGLYQRVVNEMEYETKLSILAKFAHKLSSIVVNLNDTSDFLLERICRSIITSNIVMEAVTFFPEITDIDPIFQKVPDIILKELDILKNLNGCEFDYSNLNIFEKQNQKLLSDIFISNPTISFTHLNSSISKKLYRIISLSLGINDENSIRSHFIKLKILTLFIFGYHSFAITMLVSALKPGNLEICKYNEILDIVTFYIKDNEITRNLPTNIFPLLEDLRLIVLSHFPSKILARFINYHSIPKYRREITFNSGKLKINIERCFFDRYYCDHDKSDKLIYMLYFNDKYRKFSSKSPQNVIYTMNIDKYDLLICSQFDLLYYNGKRFRLIMNSVNIHDKIKISICKSMIRLLLLKNLKNETINKLILRLLAIYRSVYYYEKMSLRIENMLALHPNILNELEIESKIPIYYLVQNDSRTNFERWKFLFKVIPFNEISPFIKSLELLYSKNTDRRFPLIAIFELFSLIGNSSLTSGSNSFPILKKSHIKILSKYRALSFNFLYEFNQTNNENFQNIYSGILMLILKHINSNKSVYLNDLFLQKLNSMSFRKILLFHMLLSNDIREINEIATLNKIELSTGLFNIWDNYWILVKIIKQMYNKLLPSFSFQMLCYAFFINKRFSRYKSLITHDGNCISQILLDLLNNLSEDTDYTLEFIAKFSVESRQKLEIITIITKILKNKTNNGYFYSEDNLFKQLNTTILRTKISLLFPEFQEKYCCIGESSNDIFSFVLDLFMDSDNEKLSLLIHKVLIPLEYSYIDILSDSIAKKLSNIEINEDSIFHIISSINSMIDKCTGINFKQFSDITKEEIITGLYKRWTITLRNNYVIFIMISMELGLNNLTNDEIFDLFIDQVTSKIKDLFGKLNITFGNSGLDLLLNESISLIERVQPKDISQSFIFDILLHLLICIRFIDVSNIQNENRLLNCRRNVSRFTSRFFIYLTKTNLINNLLFLKYWYFFGVYLLSLDDQLIFFQDVGKSAFIGLNSNSNKIVLINLTYTRIEYILARQFRNTRTDDLMVSSYLLLTGNSNYFIGTDLFSRNIYPLALNIKMQNNDEFTILGKQLSNKLKIDNLDIEGLFAVGVLFKVIINNRNKILCCLIKQMIIFKAYKKIAEILSSEYCILKRPISTKYSNKILIKLLGKFFSNLTINTEIEDTKDPISVQYHYYNILEILINRSIGKDYLNKLFGVIYHKLSSKFDKLLLCKKMNISTEEKIGNSIPELKK
ncbi:hypothetical protein HWI79_722 [Cryptosporidium felis]|nr:hypothetical protein HWI79_722 [Cryptosporidium felis]